MEPHDHKNGFAKDLIKEVLVTLVTKGGDLSIPIENAH
jgi:hypothetical protein